MTKKKMFRLLFLSFFLLGTSGQGLVDDRGSRDGTADADKQGRHVDERAVVCGDDKVAHVAHLAHHNRLDLRGQGSRSGFSVPIQLGDGGIEGAGVEDDGADDCSQPEARLDDREARRRGGEHTRAAREPRGVVKEPEVDHAQ